MANDPLRYVSAGEPLEISAAAWNALVDAARARRGSTFDDRNPAIRQVVTPGLTVAVRNDSGANRAVQSVLAITDKLLDPTNAAPEYIRKPLFIGDLVTAETDPIVILSDPIVSDGIGLAIIAGIAVVDVLINDSSHQWAKPIAGDATKLTSATSGPARILWKAGSSGTQRAVVNLLDGRGAAGSLSETHDGVGNMEFDCTADDTWVDVSDLTITIDAGTWLIQFEGWAVLEVSAGYGLIQVRLYNSTDATAYAYNAAPRGVLATDVIDQQIQSRFSVSWIVTVAGSKELNLQVARSSVGAATYTTSKLSAGNSYDDMLFNAIKIA